jgi:hypothetical protein
MEDVGVLHICIAICYIYGHLVYCAVIWYILWPFGAYILWPFGILLVIWYIFPFW